MIRIFIIGHNGNKGGVERYLSNLTSSLSHSEFEWIYSREEMVIDGKRWRRPPNRHRYLSYRRFWRRFYREVRPDVVYFNTCDIVSIDPLRFAAAAGVPVRIIHAHTTGNQENICKRQSLFHRVSEKTSRSVLERYATHLLACSEEAGKWMFDGRPFTVIKNGIPLQEYRFHQRTRSRLREKLRVREGKIIGVIGRLSPVKNPLFAVEILNQMLKKRPALSAVFLGDGELRAETQRAVSALDLQSRVHFLGEVDNVNEWMCAVDCLLMPSLFEGLPFVLIEAQAAGLPCVVSSQVSEEANVSGQLRFVDLRAPLEEWEKALESALKRPRYDAQEQLIAAGYSIEDSAGVVEALIRKALAERLYSQGAAHHLDGPFAATGR